MLRVRHDHRSLVIAPWVVAGALLLGCNDAIAADPAISASSLADASSSERPVALLVAAMDKRDVALERSQVASVDVSSEATIASGPYALGALVGAVVAVIAALRERFTRR